MSKTSTITITKDETSKSTANNTTKLVLNAGNAMLGAAEKSVSVKAVKKEEEKSADDAAGKQKKKRSKLFQRLQSLSTLREQRETEGMTLIEFERDGGPRISKELEKKGLGQQTALPTLYRRRRGYVLTSWKRRSGISPYVRNGVEKWYDECGRLVRIREFSIGRQVGVERVFIYANDSQNCKRQIAYECTYDNDGRKHGLERRYECRAETRTVRYGEDGASVDVVTGFSLCGIIYSVQYAYGQRHGKEYRQHMRSGRTLFSVDWIRGARTGKCVSYYKSGREYMVCAYAGGVKTGYQMTKSRSGDVLRTLWFVNGKKSGIESRFVDNDWKVMMWQNGTRVNPETMEVYEWR